MSTTRIIRTSPTNLQKWASDFALPDIDATLDKAVDHLNRALSDLSAARLDDIKAAMVKEFTELVAAEFADSDHCYLRLDWDNPGTIHFTLSDENSLLPHDVSVIDTLTDLLDYQLPGFWDVENETVPINPEAKERLIGWRDAFNAAAQQIDKHLAKCHSK